MIKNLYNIDTRDGLIIDWWIWADKTNIQRWNHGVFVILLLLTTYNSKQSFKKLTGIYKMFDILLFSGFFMLLTFYKGLQLQTFFNLFYFFHYNLIKIYNSCLSVTVKYYIIVTDSKLLEGSAWWRHICQ